MHEIPHRGPKRLLEVQTHNGLISASHLPEQSVPKQANRLSSPVANVVHAESRQADVVAFEQAVVEFFVEGAALLGLPKSLAAIYAICFASPEPLGFADIQARLKLSAGSISQGLKLLRNIGALKSLAARGDRRDYYTPDLELRKVVTRFLDERLQKQLETSRDRLLLIKEALPAYDYSREKVLQERLKSLRGWYRHARAALPVIRALSRVS